MNHAKSALQTLKTGDQKYDVLYVNTPWSAMPADRIANLPLNSICAENAVLLLWTDSYSASRTTELMDKWGFKFHSVFQIMDIAQHQWMKKPVAAVAVDNLEVGESTTGQAAEASARERKKNVVKKSRAPPVSQPPWWSPAPPDVVAPSRPTTEQLWLAVKGDPSAVFGNSTVAYNVINLPDVGKKSRSTKNANRRQRTPIGSTHDNTTRSGT